MRMTGRAIALSTVVIAAWALGPTAALAQDEDFFGHAECGSAGGPGCEVEAESEQSDPGSSGSDADAGSTSGDEGAGTAEADPSECDLDPACETIGLPGDATEETPEVDPVEVAHAARDDLELPEPQIATSPGPEVPVLVQVPVWLWLWLEEDVWASQEAEAEVPGGAVTVTAEPAQAQWHMGDGHTVACDGPGVAYEPGEHDPGSASPECGHTYTRASTQQPDGVYTVEVDLVWEVGWSASDGEGGELDEVVTSSSMERTVIESHGLVTDVH